MELSAAQLGRALGAKVEGDGARRLTGVAALLEAGPSDLSFFANPRYRAAAKESRAGALILAADETKVTAAAVLRSPNPYATFARAVRMFHPEKAAGGKISDRAVVDPRATLGPTVTVDALAVIGAGARIGDGTRVGAGVVVGENVTIGQDCRIFPNVTLYDGVTIGSRVILHAGAVIGSDGFGFAKEGPHYLKVPQVGTVVVEDDVEIGAGSTVDRGALGRTTIGKGTKIDNLVQIAHNCTIGPHSVIAAQTGIAGSVTLGARATLAGQSGIAGHLHLGDDVIVSGKCAVFKDLPAKSFVSGIPARPHRQWLRREAKLERVGKIEDRIARLEQRLPASAPTRRKPDGQRPRRSKEG